MSGLRKLWAWLTGARVVWLMDYSGETNQRIARPAGFGLWKAERMGLGVRPVLLHPNGRVTGACYVDRWEFDQ